VCVCACACACVCVCVCPLYLAGLWVFITRFFWIRVLTEDQAVYLLPRSGYRHIKVNSIKIQIFRTLWSGYPVPSYQSINHQYNRFSQSENTPKNCAQANFVPKTLIFHAYRLFWIKSIIRKYFQLEYFLCFWQQFLSNNNGLLLTGHPKTGPFSYISFRTSVCSFSLYNLPQRTPLILSRIESRSQPSCCCFSKMECLGKVTQNASSLLPWPHLYMWALCRNSKWCHDDAVMCFVTSSIVPNGNLQVDQFEF